ncbi:MAG: hypothetical protein HOC70_03100 [Gammaproteobacteria bacterium]|jgi:hypothetical protein|nr:hypothetical protein [Gammaproteobacteria bacterium]MBT4492203.1 hypothetical protein [Gammaproteobacteria bacterium]
MTAISQLQMSYSPEEDRILLRVNTDNGEEFRFWLTRRFSQLLVQALAAHRAVDPDVSTQATPVAKQAVQTFKQEAAQEKGDFEQEFRQSESFPLGDKPVLAYKLSYSIEKNKLKLSFEPKSGHGINIVLDSDLNFNVSKLLRGASEKGQWFLDWGSAPENATESRVIN